MALELLIARFVFSLVTLNSVYSLGETEKYISPTQFVPSCKKCPPGFSTFCPQNETSRCVPCVEGTFSENQSRRRECRPCSSCHDDEFELRSCTATSNVLCKTCSKCAPGFVVLKPCERTMDTVCEKCPVVKGYMSDVNIGCNENRTEDRLVVKKINERENPEDSMTIIEVEKPLSDGSERKRKYQQEPAVDGNHRPVTQPLSSSYPTPSSSFSKKETDTLPQRVLSNQSIDFVYSSSSVKGSLKSIVGGRKSFGPSVTPTMSIDHESPPKVQGTKPTTNKVDDTSAEEPSSHGMQGDDGNVPRRTARRMSVNQTSKRIVSPSEANILDLNPRGVIKEPSKESTTDLESADEKPVSENTDTSRSTSSPDWLWGVVVVATGVGIVLAVIVVGIRWRQCRKSNGCFFICPQPRCRRPRCPAPSNCCDGNSVSSVAEQNHGRPVHLEVPASVTIEHESEDSPPNSNNQTLHTYLPQTVVAEVHPTTPSVFEVFNIRNYITQAEDTFNSAGGKLTAPDSDVIINIDSGAVPEGVNQLFFFRVVYDETSLLRNIPETPDSTLISPVIQCGPENINLLKPVEIIVPHCLYLDEVKKESICVYRREDGQVNWERVPSASEKNCQSKFWFTVKKDSIHIKTKTFSFWSIFACGGPKRKRATVFASRPSPKSDLIYLRFYIYSDNEDSKKRVEVKDKDRFPDSTPSKEKPFKMYNDSNDVTVKLTDLQEGWGMDKTSITQTYTFETAYGNGFRSKDSCDFVVKPTHQGVEDFSCILRFQQEEHTTEYTIYVNPGYTPGEQDECSPENTSHINPRFPQRQSKNRFSIKTSRVTTGAGSTSVVQEENEEIDGQKNKTSSGSPTKVSDSPSHGLRSLGCDHKGVTQEHCNCICAEIGAKWKKVLRNLGTKEEAIENLEENNTRVEEKCYKGLLEWSKSPLTQKATTKTLCDALFREGCFKALETLSKEGVSCDACASHSESNPHLDSSRR